MKDEDVEWAIPLAERIKYDQIFDTLNPTNGLLPGSKVKPVLLNSKLPVDVLGHVWDLSDIDGDGSLDRLEFSVAMNLVYKALQKIPVPPSLSIEMVPPTKRKQMAPNVTSPPPSSPLPAATTTTEKDSKPTALVANSETKLVNESSVTWVVTAPAKAQCDELFTKTDTDKDGYVSGSEIKKIFIKSGLPQSLLARIWSLCDTRNLGKLNRDQFALAMYLIQQKLKGVEVPPKLTPEMIPPSARRNSLGDNVPPPGVVFDMNTPGMKEIEALSNEIEQFKSSKQKLDGEKSNIEESMKTFESNSLSLQQEIDVVINAVKQLNNQKIEAQKRLDDLDTKKVQMEKDMKSAGEQYEKLQQKIVDLKDQMSNRDNINKTMEEDLRSRREDLNQLRHQELELELKFEASHRRLVQLAKLLHGAEMQITQAELNIDRLAETNKQIMLSSHLYDQLINNEITEQEALAIGSLTVTSPTLNFDLSSFDAMSDMVQTTNDEMEEFQTKLNDLQMSADDLEDVLKDEDEKDASKSTENVETESKEPWSDVPFAKAPAKNDPFAIGFITSEQVKSPVNPEDPFGQGAFAPPGIKPARPSRPPQPKKSDGGGGPPPRPRSPVPPRPRSPAPPGRPKSPANPRATPPSRPPAPSKSPQPASDDEEAFFAQMKGGSSSGGGGDHLSFADFPSDKFASDYDLK